MKKANTVVEENQKLSSEALITLTSDIVAAHVGNNDVAPAYAEKRRDLAKKFGLGRKAGTPAPKTRRTKKA